MSEKVKLKISPAVAAYAVPGISSAEKLAGLEAASEMAPIDRVTLLFCLMRDKDSSVKDSASAAFALLPEGDLLECIYLSATHPAILDAICRIHYFNPHIVAALLENTALSRQAAEFLREIESEDGENKVDGRELAADADREGAGSDSDGVAQSQQEDEYPAAEDEPLEEGEEYFSKYQMIQQMGISEKIKMALTGDKEWRSVLINDNNKLVSSSVIRNPRITDAEIIRILKVGVQNDDIIRLICANKEWVKNHQIRKALVDCPKTPLPNALRFLSTLGDKDIAAYAKSRNISTVISTHAKRIILAKKR